MKTLLFSVFSLTTICLVAVYWMFDFCYTDRNIWIEELRVFESSIFIRYGAKDTDEGFLVISNPYAIIGDGTEIITGKKIPKRIINFIAESDTSTYAIFNSKGDLINHGEHIINLSNYPTSIERKPLLVLRISNGITDEIQISGE